MCTSIRSWFNDQVFSQSYLSMANPAQYSGSFEGYDPTLNIDKSAKQIFNKPGQDTNLDVAKN
jgi:hypothetical protein